MEAVIISNCEASTYYNSYTVKGKNDKFRNKKFIVYLSKNSNLEYGDKVEIIGELYKPKESRNYKGFSYKQYLQTEKIYGTIKAKQFEIKSKNNTIFIFRISNLFQNKIISKVKDILPEETAGVLIGLMLGDKTYIPEDIVDNFQKSSLAHILAVSGAHVSYIILGLTYLVSISKMPKKSGYIFTIFVLIVFIFITNFSVSVIRACIMAIILLLSKLLYRKADIKNTIAFSILIILIYNPYTITSLSMQLSYLGTIGVIFLAPNLGKLIEKILGKSSKIKVKIVNIISIPISAQITILPIMIKNFNTISLTFLISNLIAVPLLGICIIGGYVLTTISFIWLWPVKKICIIFNIILKCLILIAKIFANLKYSNIYVITPNTITILIYYIIVIGLYYYLKFKFNKKGQFNRMTRLDRKILNISRKIDYKKIILIIAILIIIIEIPYKNYNGKLKIFFIDVDQRR